MTTPTYLADTRSLQIFPVLTAAQIEKAGRFASAPAGCTVLPSEAPHGRAMLIVSAELGDLLMRAFILRRAVLIGPSEPDQATAAEIARHTAWLHFR